MAKVYAPFCIERTMCGLTFYKANGQNLVRKKSSLSARRVKTSPAFALTRYHADLLKQASKIASEVYRALPVNWRQYWMFRAFTGEAMQLIKEGKKTEEVIKELKKVYIDEILKTQEKRPREQGTRDKEQGTGNKGQEGNRQREKRKYVKKEALYWNTKTGKAQKRKAQKEKLHYYAQLLAKASTIASVVYKQLPANKRQYAFYKFLTGQAIRLLKEELEEETVLEILRSEARSRMSAIRSRMSEVR